LRETTRVLAETYDNWEIVLVDDGSIDGTPERVKALLGELEGIRLLVLSRRFGPEVALNAGLEAAIGDVIVTLDPASDPPELVPSMIGVAIQRHAVVQGVDCRPLKSGLIRRIGSRFFVWACRRLLDLTLVPRATGFRVMSRQAVNAIVEIKDQYRHLGLYASYTGFSTYCVEYEPRPRSGWTAPVPSLFQTVDAAISLVVTHSLRPLRWVSWLGLFASSLNLAYMAYVVLIGMFKRRVAEGWVTLSLQHAVMFLLLFVILTVVTEYVGRILSETRDRPLYYIRETAESSVLVPGEERRNVVTEL